ncbi:Tn3 family transposase, partial [Klebsiella pneumoniae]|nr:Tn3 family transposase [Klebsiella pneumoniae]
EDTSRTFTALGASLLGARSDGTPLAMAVASSVAWDRLAQLVATGTQLSNTIADEPLAYVGQGYQRFRRYATGVLRCRKLEAATVAGPLVAEAMTIRERKGVAWHERQCLRASPKENRQLRARENGRNRRREGAGHVKPRQAFG